MAKQHGITETTYKKFVIDSGAVYLNYGEAGELKLGATRGGSTFVIETDYRDMPVDGAKGPVKGGRRIVRSDATLTANFVEQSAELLKRALPGSAITDFPTTPGKTHDQINRSLEIALGDYATNVTLVGEVTGADTPAVFMIKNALVDGSFEIGMTEGEEVVSTLAYKAHFDPTDLDTEPWEMRFPLIP